MSERKKYNHVVYGDSVAGNTLVRLGDGSSLPICDLFTEVSHIDGDKQYCNLDVDGLTFDPDTETVVSRPIKYVMRHHARKKMYRVYLTNQQYVDVTEDHSIMGYVNTRLRKTEQYRDQKITEVKPTELGHGINSGIRLGKVLFTPDDPRITEDEAVFLGAIIGDGSLDRSDLQLSVGRDDMTEITETIINPLVQTDLIESHHVRKNGHDVRILGVGIRNLVREHLYSEDKKNIPTWMHMQPIEIQAAFLRGLFTADGTTTNQGLVRLTTVRHDIAAGAYEMLLRCGIACSWFEENTENSYDGKFSGTFSKHINIINRDRFAELVGFSLTRKQSRIKPISKFRNTTMVMGDDVSVAKISHVEELPDFDGYVYDLEIEDTHTFFANDILVHNTDSVYLRLSHYAEMHDLELDEESAVAIADSLQVKLQDDLPEIIGKQFLTPAANIEMLEPGREIVGRRMLSKDKKKRYAAYIINNEGKKVDKVKIMGMESQRSDTPKFIQTFLKKLLEMVVKDGSDYSTVKAVIDDFRKTFRDMDPWRQGSPGRVKNLANATKAYNEYVRKSNQIGVKKPLMHITVKAAMNTNKLMEFHGETRWARLRDGDKVEVIYLKDNPMQMESVAIPVGETYVPEWFQELPFDIVRMEEKLLDKKIFNIIGDVLGWDFTPPKTYVNDIGSTMDDFYD